MAGNRSGSIYRISLENFVTYSQVEFFPGPNLNIIIGPNGTGKSTFICAIVLGLCGKTSDLGRAKKIAEYVRSGCNDATIEIELFRDEDYNKIIITRNFDLENVSHWYIDGKSVREKRVQELISSLNIKVDNLCQLLPQDKVHDFSKMNRQQLLHSTQLEVGGLEFVNLFDQLVQSKLYHRSLLKRFDSNSQQIKENEQLNARIESVIANMEELKNINHQIYVSKKKLQWAKYEEIKIELDSLHSDKVKAIELVKECKKKIMPFRKHLDKLENMKAVLLTQKKTLLNALSNIKSTITDFTESSYSCMSKICNLENDLNVKKTQQNNIKRDIEHAKVTLQKIESDRDNLVNTYGDETVINNNMAEIHKPIKVISDDLVDLKNERSKYYFEIDSTIKPQIRLIESGLLKLSDAQSKKLEILKNYNQDTYSALQWLNANRNLFKGNFYEPMFLKLNFSNSTSAKYLENTVAMRDLIAFTFEDDEDMNLFLHKVRTEMQLKRVNAICSVPSNQLFKPPININNLKTFGFYTYLIDLVSGPDAIIHFLCKQYGIHRIPIGNDKTYDMGENIPKEINYYYSENHRFTIKISVYTGDKSISSSEIRPAKILANSVDQEEINNKKLHLHEMQLRHQSVLNKIKGIDGEINQKEEKLNELFSSRQKLRESSEQIKTVLSRIRMQQNKISTMKKEKNINIKQETAKCKKEIERITTEYCSLRSQTLEKLKQCTVKRKELDFLGIHLKMNYNDILTKENEIKELQNNSLNAESILTNIDKKLMNTKLIAKEKLLEAKALTENISPNEKDFPYTREFAKLPNDVDSLNEHLNVLQARAECMDQGDEEAVNLYKSRKNIINNFVLENEDITKNIDKYEKQMIELKEKWLTPIKEKISRINSKFGEMFAQLGCAGEVHLSKDGAEDDYDKYGINILVRFREEENLQQLTQHVQSGGERALATALFLMALQQFSRAPFRCVDEINQGMDRVNERKMFDLLIKITTEYDSSQYFLLTPKLLYDLKYSKNSMVNTIMNGPYNIKFNQWKFKKSIDVFKHDIEYLKGITSQ